MRLSKALFAFPVAAVATVTLALAQPSVPATFWGSVTVDGAPAPAGSEVRAVVNGVDCTQAPAGQRPVFVDGGTAAYVVYVVHETQRPGCATAGSRITFTIDGRPAVQTAVWQPGPVHLDLSTGNQPPIPLPTGTIAAALETAAGGTEPAGSVQPTLSRPSGTPPTDDVRFDRTPQPPGSGQETPAVKEDGGSSVLPWVLGVLAAIVLGAGAAGFFLSRRYRQPEA